MDGAIGPIVYRIDADTLDALADRLQGLDLEARCARDVARAAWGGCVVGFDGIALVVVPGDHAAVFADYVWDA